MLRKHRERTLDLLDRTGWNTGTQNIFPRWFNTTILFLCDSKWRIWPRRTLCHLLFLHFSVSSLRFILTEPHFSLPSLQFNPRKPLEGLLSLCSLLPSHSCLTSSVLSTLPSSSHLPHSSPALCSFPAWSSPAHPAACGSWARRRSCRPASNPDGCSCSSWLHNQRALLHYCY